MKKILLLSLITSIIIFSGYAQVPDTVWTKFINNGYSNCINSIKFSPDDSLILVAGGSNIVPSVVNQYLYLLDRTSGTITRTFNVTCPVYTAKFTPSGDTIIALSADTTLTFWSTATGQLLKTINNDEEMGSFVISSSGNKIYFTENRRFSGGQTWFEYDTINVWNISTDSIDNKIPIQQMLGRIEIDSSNTYLLYNRGLPVNNDLYYDQIHLYNLTNEHDTILGSHSANVRNLCFSRNGTRAITTSDDMHYKLWDLTNDTLLIDTIFNDDLVRYVRFSHNSQYLFLAHSPIDVLQLDTFNLSFQYDTNQLKGWVTNFELSNDGNYLAVGVLILTDTSVNFYVYLLNAKEQAYSPELKDYENQIKILLKNIYYVKPDLAYLISKNEYKKSAFIEEIFYEGIL